MRVLVTGGAGFIGANLLYLLARNHPEDTLVTLDALTYAGHRESVRPLEDSGRLEFHHGDIRSRETVEPLVRAADAVVHLAAESHVDRSIADAIPFLETNVLGTGVLLEAARRADLKRFHLVSTDEVLGSLPLDRPDLKFTATSPYDPRSPYAASKAGADHLARAYFHTYGLPVTLSNCSNNFGPYHHPEKLIPLAVTNLLRGRKVPIYGDGKNVRDWIHVEDHCSALDLILRRGTPGETYLIGADQERTNNEVVRALLHILGKGAEWIEYVPDRLGHDRRYAIDARLIRETLGWRPRFEFEEALRQTVQWYSDHREWWMPLVRA